MLNVTRSIRLTLVAAVCLAGVALAQDRAALLKEYTRQIGGDGLPLSLVHLNARTVPVIFQPPTLYAIRARASEFTLLYVQGTAQRDVDLDTTNFVIEQDGETVASTPMNIKHFERGTVSVPRGERVDGVLSFARRIDVSRPFTVRHGGDSVEFRFTPGQVREMTPPAPNP